MVSQTKAQKDTVERVMHEFKHRELETSAGDTVHNPKQAIAIALREAGAAQGESPETNARTLRRTKKRERQADVGKTRAELYEEAKRRKIPGRAKMTKAALQKALAS